MACDVTVFMPMLNVKFNSARQIIRAEWLYSKGLEIILKEFRFTNLWSEKVKSIFLRISWIIFTFWSPYIANSLKSEM